jgi:hypothetical protein
MSYTIEVSIYTIVVCVFFAIIAIFIAIMSLSLSFSDKEETTLKKLLLSLDLEQKKVDDAQLKINIIRSKIEKIIN